MLAAKLGHEPRRVGNEGRLASLAAMRDGREKGGVRLDQHPICREYSRGLLQVLRILERHDARKGNVEAEVERTTSGRPLWRAASMWASKRSRWAPRSELS